MTLPEDPHTLAKRLTQDCRHAGLSADMLCPTRVRVSKPGVPLAEVVRIMPDEDESLSLYWRTGERICPADDTAAVALIRRVVGGR